MTGNVTTAERSLEFERVFKAPRALVFKAWTEPERLRQWWGPAGWTLPVCNLDLRPGGVWHYCMRGPEGEESWGKAVYQEIVEPERLVYADRFSDAEGNLNEDMPELLVTVTFADQDGATKVSMRVDTPTVEQLQTLVSMGMIAGMNETLDRLEAHLAG
jgi:uncharacterized protein YndB with AHSA1/START domain